jgi:ABC-type branched-subunit amino acid transport system ATPase component
LSDDAAAEATSVAVAPSARRVQGVSLRTVELVAGYDRSPVIHGVSIDVQPGEIVSIVGPNGSGKSTLLKAVVGIVEIMSGRVLLGERDITGSSPENVARSGVGYVPQVDDVFAPLSVRENLEMGGYLLKPREVGNRIDHVLEVFPQLRRMVSRRAGKLSGGERKMLAMSRALMLEPPLVMLDEPTANLAPMIATSVRQEQVRQLAQTGASVLIVEQRAKAVLEVSDRTYVLGGGQLRMEGTPSELAASPEFVESFLGGRGMGTR